MFSIRKKTPPKCILGSAESYLLDFEIEDLQRGNMPLK